MPADQPITPREAKRLRAIGHKLRPLVTVGDKGVTDAFLAELDRALGDHELVKIRLNQPKAERAIGLTRITEASGAQVIQTIGRMALLLRRAAKPKPHLSNLIREF